MEADFQFQHPQSDWDSIDPGHSISVSENESVHDLKNSDRKNQIRKPFHQKKISPSPGPGWGPIRVGARSGLQPIWALMGTYGPDFASKTLILMKNHKIVNKHIKDVKSEKNKNKNVVWR